MKLTAINNQNGAALVVGLVVLLVMTLLGVSSMSSITTELKIANNSQTHMTAFQVAASGINLVLNEDATLDDGSTIDLGGGGAKVMTYNTPDTNENSTSTVTATYSGCLTVPYGYSLTQDVTMKGVVQDIQSVAEVKNASNEGIGMSTHVNGVQVIRPGGPTGASFQ